MSTAENQRNTNWGKSWSKSKSSWGNDTSGGKFLLFRRPIKSTGLNVGAGSPHCVKGEFRAYFNPVFLSYYHALSLFPPNCRRGEVALFSSCLLPRLQRLRSTAVKRNQFIEQTSKKWEHWLWPRGFGQKGARNGHLIIFLARTNSNWYLKHGQDISRFWLQLITRSVNAIVRVLHLPVHSATLWLFRWLDNSAITSTEKENKTDDIKERKKKNAKPKNEKEHKSPVERPWNYRGLKSFVATSLSFPLFFFVNVL